LKSQSFEVQPQAGVGAEICGANFTRPLDQESVSFLLDALAEYGVLFFHDQDISPAQHIALAEALGTINVNRFFTPVEDHPTIAEVRKDPGDKHNIGDEWHTDHSYDVRPALGSILYARTVPEVGGDTMFANMHTAYQTLSDGLRKQLSSMTAVHSSRHAFDPATLPDELVNRRYHNLENATQDAVHPVVVRHPLSGKSVLYVNPGFTVKFTGWTVEESKPLLSYLYQHASKPEFTCRFRWRKGSLAFWDNRATWHYALNDYHGSARLMHRITLEGDALESATA
jgi:taurine dioxygenase